MKGGPAENMKTPDELIEEVKVIKNALNLLEIRGEQNANNMLFACQRCDALIDDIKAIVADSLSRRLKNDTATEAGE